MRYGRVLKPEKIGVMSDNDPALSEPISGLLLVLGFEQPRLLRGGDVNPAAAEAISYGRVAALIQVEANRPGHRPS
jgi:hypothetical protein